MTVSVERLVYQHLALNAKAIRDEIRPDCGKFLERRELFRDVPEAFAEAYEKFVLEQVMGFVVWIFQLNPEEAASVLTFEVLRKLWNLDEKGYDI